MLILASAVEEKLENRDAAHDQPAKDDDSLDEGILDKGGQLTPIDDLASPEDSHFLGFEYTGEQADKMVLSNEFKIQYYYYSHNFIHKCSANKIQQLM